MVGHKYAMAMYGGGDIQTAMEISLYSCGLVENRDRGGGKPAYILYCAQANHSKQLLTRIFFFNTLTY